MMSISTPVDSQSLKLVELEYSRLQDCIGELAEMLQESLDRQKDEIECIHKTRMGLVNVEVEKLKLEISELDQSIATNERACLLENERDWYKKEALHLDKVLEQTKVHEKELVEALDESEQDKKWMKAQIEKLTVNNWKLEKKLKELGFEVECSSNQNRINGNDVADVAETCVERNTANQEGKKEKGVDNSVVGNAKEDGGDVKK